MAISICGVLLAPACAVAQADPAPPRGQTRQLTTTPRDEPPVAPAAAPVMVPLPTPSPAAPPSISIPCDGGTVSGGVCTCPNGYALLPAASGSGGICARSHADNCRGGDLTVAGVCLCNGRVTMSGETYALEFVGGKCVPKRCPERSYLKDGKCVASNDNRFSFACRTGYIPDETASIAAGLHCVPDPTFCPAGQRQKNGTCDKSTAIAIDCFEGRCTCGPNADWVNYLCQCKAPYRNVNGTCAGGATAASANEHDAGKPELQSSEPSHRRKACGRGMVRAHSGACVAARPRLPDAGELGVYYQRAQRYRDYPGQQQDVR